MIISLEKQSLRLLFLFVKAKPSNSMQKFLTPKYIVLTMCPPMLFSPQIMFSCELICKVLGVLNQILIKLQRTQLAHTLCLNN